MSAIPAAPLAPCRDPYCRSCVPASQRQALADVIDLRERRPAVAPSRTVYWVRRAVVLGILAVVVLALGAGVNRLVAAPADAPSVAGAAVLEPGDTLWDLAVEHTPTGQDVRTTLRAIQTLNGFQGATVPVWTVVLLPSTD
jgi:hypothetical protein